MPVWSKNLCGLGGEEKGTFWFFEGDRNVDILSRGRARDAPSRGGHVQHALLEW